MRIEEDFLGKIEVPKDAYYGIFTVRASSTFKLSGILVRPQIIRSVAIIKKCAAKVNYGLGKLDQKVANAIVSASDEVISGKFDNQFIIDEFQAGAGTPLHMNTNEVIANRAEELLGGKKGQYKLVTSNNHVNMSQSSNDVVPTAIRIATYLMAKDLLLESSLLVKTLYEKGQLYKDTIKIGRTHLQDAVPMTYGQTFDAFARAIEKDMKGIENSLDFVCELGIGGTATGSGITAHPEFRFKLVDEISKETKSKFTPAKDTVETTQSMNDLSRLSGALRSYATTLNRIANDLRILVSGPKGGISELIIPEIEPGSSIMPGKINPSIPEAVNLLCFKVIGNDLAISLGSQSGQLELNFATPLIGQSLVESLTLLTKGTKMFNEKCIKGTKVDLKNTSENFNKSICYATAFNPYLGYSLVSKLVRESLDSNVSLRDLIVSKGILESGDVDQIINSATGPSLVDEKIKSRVKIQK